MTKAYDVVVIGGGTAGVIAAVQAGRAGASTLLIEKSGMLGGTITSAGVNFPGLFHAWGKQVIAGIGWELVEQAVLVAGGTMPDFSDFRQRHWRLQIPIDRFVYAALCDQAVLGAGVELSLHSMPAGLSAAESGGWSLKVCTKEGLTNIQARVVIDASGDANAVKLAGLETIANTDRQPATLVCQASGYDFDQLDIDAINAALDQEVAAGRMQYTDASWNTQKADVGGWLRQRGSNVGHIHGYDASTSAGRSGLEVEARARLLRLFRFSRQQPGLEGVTIDYISPECGVRETVTIQGRVKVTVEDYCSGKQWPDAVCHAFYPIDLHTSDGAGLRCEPLAEGVVPTVPRDALLPVDGSNLIVAGRCLSSDQLANSALRVQATSMATGQAAGALAALAASSHCDPSDVPIDRLRVLLRDHGAIVPE